MESRTWAGAIGMAIAGLISGCSNDQEEPARPPAPDPCAAQSCPYPYASFDGMTPVVSLRRDLLADDGEKPGGGVLRRACTQGPCHGTRKEAGLFIGPPALDPETRAEVLLTDADVDRFLGAVDGVLRRARTVDMPLVDPGNPENSFLMRKIDGCYDGITGCVALEPDPPHACGDRMPLSSPPLCADERDMIRRWIAQGATDDR